MRAWQVHTHGEPADVLRLAQVDRPTPGEGQVRIRVAAAGLGLPDVFMCRGTYPLTPPLPFTPGQEVAGEITAVGPGVPADLVVGARVLAVTAFPTGHGGFAEEALAYAGSTFLVPDGLDDADAAGFWIPHVTAWIGLVERARVAEGEWLAVLGAAGSSGSAAIQLGRALGARVVAVAAGDPDKVALCRSLGADAVIDHREGDVEVVDALRAATGGRGVDVVYDPVGGELGDQMVDALASGGRHLLVGFAGGRWPQPPLHRLVRVNGSLVGVYAGGFTRAELLDIHRQLAELVAGGALRGTVSDRTPFAELPAALTRLAGRTTVGKAAVLLT